MTDKFPGRSDEKQQVVSLDLARFQTATGERAVVAAAEVDRITLFWTRRDGSWANRTLNHPPLLLDATSPARTAHIGWSTRIGLVPAPGRLLVVYKRRFTASVNALFIDELAFDEASDQFAPFPTIHPGLPPLGAFGYNAGPGLSLWADVYNGEILVVTQAFPFFVGNATTPDLVLFRAPIKTYSDASTWRSTVLDQGGFDFDVRRDGDRLGVIHRRRSANLVAEFFLPTDVMFAPPIRLPFSDLPQAVPRIDDMTTPLTFVSVDLATDAVAEVDATVPWAEHPQLHSLAPVIVTGDRLRDGILILTPGSDNNSTVECRNFVAQRTIAVRSGGVWSIGSLSVPTPTGSQSLPLVLQELAPIQTLVEFATPPIAGRNVEIHLSTLVGLSPLALLGGLQDSRDLRPTFLHQLLRFDGVAASTFAVGPSKDAGVLNVTPLGFSLIDINHGPIPPTTANDRTERENLQFAPFNLRGPFEHTQDFLLRGPPRTLNQLGSLVVAHTVSPETFFGFVHMGDGGARVSFERLSIPPPSVPADTKRLSFDMVPDLGEAGRAWVELSTPGYVPYELLAYRVPDERATTFAPNEHLRSIASGLQPALDSLAVFAVFQAATSEGLLGGEMELDAQGSPRRLILRENTASALQGSLLALAPLGSFTVEEPFRVEMRIEPGVMFVGEEITFSARVPDPPAGPLTFRWTFSDGTTSDERSLTRTFAAPAGVTPRLDVDLAITLEVTAADGRTATVRHREFVLNSVWGALWAPFDGMNFEDSDGDGIIDTAREFQFRQLSLRASRYGISYQATGAGTPEELQIEYLDTHDADYRFRPNAGQGTIHCRMGASFSSSGMAISGLLGSVVEVREVSGRLRLSKHFAPGTLTSDQRRGEQAVETVRDSRGMLPSALACKPLPGVDVEMLDVETDVRLTDQARNLTWLAGALLALGFGAMVLAALLPILMALLPLAAIAVVLTAGLGAVLALLVGFGLAALVTELVIPMVLRSIIEERLQAPENQQHMRNALENSSLLTNVGEGLAENLAVRSIRQGQADGHPLADPTPDGRNRFRPQLFETVVVVEDRCKIKLNTARG